MRMRTMPICTSHCTILGCHRVLAAALTLFLAHPASTRAEDWPQFRGPNSSGILASDAAIPVEFGPTRRVLWKQALPGGLGAI